MSGSNILTGRVWKFGDNISTDLIMPSFGAMSSPNMDPHEAALFCMRANRPDWAEKVRPGDIVIAGKNFGCGSSRPAAKMLKGLGIQLVVAESVARIFFRNSINLGMAILSCPGVHDAFEEGEKSTWRPERSARWTPGERSVVRRCPPTVLPHRSSAPAV